MTDYPIKPCIDCGFTRPQLATLKVDGLHLMYIHCPECDKSSDAHYTVVGACEQWDNNRERLLPTGVRETIKKIMKRHSWRTKKKDYLP